MIMAKMKKIDLVPLGFIILCCVTTAVAPGKRGAPNDTSTDGPEVKHRSTFQPYKEKTVTLEYYYKVMDESCKEYAVDHLMDMYAMGIERHIQMHVYLYPMINTKMHPKESLMERLKVMPYTISEQYHSLVHICFFETAKDKHVEFWKFIYFVGCMPADPTVDPIKTMMQCLHEMDLDWLKSDWLMHCCQKDLENITDNMTHMLFTFMENERTSPDFDPQGTTSPSPRSRLIIHRNGVQPKVFYINEPMNLRGYLHTNYQMDYGSYFASRRSFDRTMRNSYGVRVP